MISAKPLASRLSAIAVVCALPVVPALASGPVAPPPQVVDYVLPSPTFDWAGAYGGLSYSSLRGESRAAVTVPMANDTGLGAFAGYNWQNGNFVYGGELSYIAFDTPYVGPVNRQRNALELRGRLGYAVNNVLFYGYAGLARSEIFGLGAWHSESGFGYGLGVQYHVSRGMFVGLEAGRRDLSATIGGVNVDTQIDSISLRVGFQF